MPGGLQPCPVDLPCNREHGLMTGERRQILEAFVATFGVDTRRAAHHARDLQADPVLQVSQLACINSSLCCTIY